MKKIIFKNKTKNIFLVLFIFSIILLVLGYVNIYLKQQKLSETVRAENQCGCSPNSSCSLNGQYWENFHHCEGNTPIFEIYICSNGKWTYAYSDDAGTCPNNCGATPIPIPTSGGCPCRGGVFNVTFIVSRTLNPGEQINCTVEI